MPEWLWFFNIIYTFLIIDYMKQTYGFKYDNQNVNAAVILAFYLIHTFVNLLQNPTLNIISDIMLINITCWYFFKSRTEKIYFNAIYHFYLLTLDLIFTCASATINDAWFTDWQKSDGFISYIALNFIIYIITYEKIIKLFKQYFVFFDDAKNMHALAKITVIQYILSLALTVWFSYEKRASEVGIILMLMIAGSIVIMFLRFIYVQKNKEDELRQKLFEEYALELENIAESEKDTRIFVSDICLNHIANPRDLQKQTQAEVDGHIEHIQSKLSNINYYRHKNNTIDAIITLAETKAKRQAIDLKTDIDDIDWSFMKKKDIIIIMSGLIHNAIITCTKNMTICMYTRNKHILITVSHSCDMSQIEEGNEVLYPSRKNLTKTRTGMIINTAQKYDAEINFSVEKNIFTASILITTNKY